MIRLLLRILTALTTILISVVIIRGTTDFITRLIKSDVKYYDFPSDEINTEENTDALPDFSPDEDLDISLGGGVLTENPVENLPEVDEYVPEIPVVSPEPIFNYIDQGGKVYLRLAPERTAVLKFGESDVSVEDSFLYDSPNDMETILSFVKYYLSMYGYEMLRTDEELIGEYRLHTFLYNLGYKQEQTGTLNWDYGYDERWYVNFASLIIGRLEV